MLLAFGRATHASGHLHEWTQHLADRLREDTHDAGVQVGQDEQLPDPVPSNNPRCFASACDGADAECRDERRGRIVSRRQTHSIVSRRLTHSIASSYVPEMSVLCLCDCRKRSRSSAGMTEAQTRLQHRVIQKDDFSRMQVLLLIDHRLARSY